MGLGMDAALVLQAAKQSTSGNKGFTMMATKRFGRESYDMKCKRHED